jgi:hypothetical protein
MLAACGTPSGRAAQPLRSNFKSNQDQIGRQLSEWHNSLPMHPFRAFLVPSERHGLVEAVEPRVLFADLSDFPWPSVWPETQFDRVWRVDYADGKATLTDLPQGLLPGDSR